QADAPASDTPLPPSGTPFVRVSGEGALSAFLGEDPNGTWTLTVVDDSAGNTGTLRGWSLRVVTAGVCGDGVVDPGETCDDGNAVDGDGCESNCTPTATRPGSESACTDCRDDDGNGLVDLADPACAASGLAIDVGRISRTRLALAARLTPPPV